MSTQVKVQELDYAIATTPIGDLLLLGAGKALKEIRLPWSRRQPIEDGWRASEAGLREPLRQLREYFEGKRRSFELDLAPDGTPFQLDVWRALVDIPYGLTLSYGELAQRVGRPRAARAIGAANGANPIPIVVPCHRVIGADGSLTGFGGGLPIKRALLALEQRHEFQLR